MKPLDEQLKGHTKDCRCSGIGNVCPACIARVFRLGVMFELKRQSKQRPASSLRAKLATAQARIAELEAALRRLVTCAEDYDATVGDFLDEACPDTENPMQCARVRMLDAEVAARAALTAEEK